MSQTRDEGVPDAGEATSVLIRRVDLVDLVKAEVVRSDLGKLLAEIEAVVPEGGGWCSVEKAATLVTLLVALRPTVVVELGVWEGGSAIPMAMALRAIGAGQLVAVDAWAADASIAGQEAVHARWWGETQGQDGHDRAHATFVSRLQKHAIGPERCVIRRQRTDEAAVPPVIDVLHHDANHGPQAVLDVARWAPAVRLGGFLVFDDLDWPGDHVRRARDRALSTGFVELYPLGTGCVMQRVRPAR